MKRQEIPLLEYDGTVPAILEPSKLIAPMDVPEQCVLTFFQDVIDGYRRAGRLVEVRRLGSERGHNPLYEMEINGRRLAVIHRLRRLRGAGWRFFQVGHVIVPVTAVRDEGTSYHYQPPSRKVEPTVEAVEAITAVLESQGIGYMTGKTWTIDAFYRETPEKVALRRAEGCICVEMETIALCAVAKFRGVTFGQLLYGGDDLSGDEWDSRDWQNRSTARESLFALAAAACLLL